MHRLGGPGARPPIRIGGSGVFHRRRRRSSRRRTRKVPDGACTSPIPRSRGPPCRERPPFYHHREPARTKTRFTAKIVCRIFFLCLALTTFFPPTDRTPRAGAFGTCRRTWNTRVGPLPAAAAAAPPAGAGWGEGKRRRRSGKVGGPVWRALGARRAGWAWTPGALGSSSTTTSTVGPG